MVMVNVDAENGYRTHSLYLSFVTIASIIFENANVDIDTKCEWAFIPTFTLHRLIYNYMNYQTRDFNIYPLKFKFALNV